MVDVEDFLSFFRIYYFLMIKKKAVLKAVNFQDSLFVLLQFTESWPESSWHNQSGWECYHSHP